MPCGPDDVLFEMYMVGPEWQPIETAPKDGTWVFVGHALWQFPIIARWDMNHRVHVECWSDIDSLPIGYSAEYGHEPTHWMPLPEPPK